MKMRLSFAFKLDDNKRYLFKEIGMKKKNTSKVLVIGISLVIILVSSFSIYSLRYLIKYVYNIIFPPKTVENLDLTTEEKLEDFQYLYNTLITSMPQINQFKEIYGFSFSERKDEYEELIRNTNTDMEFYATMEAILQENSSFHTDFIYPTEYGMQNCYHKEAVSTDRNVISYANYWEQQLKNLYQNNDSRFLSFVYQNGDYTYDDTESTEKSDSISGTLLSVNGMSVDEYITQHLSTFSMHYDGAEKKAYRRRIVFNDKHGSPCEITYQTHDGDVRTISRFMDILYEEIFWEERYERLNTPENDTSYEPVISCADEKISYVKIDDMELSEAKAVKSAMKNIKTDYVILDLRENYGGYNWFAERYIYPYLFVDDFKEKHVFYISDSEQNHCFTKDLFLRLYFDMKKTDDNPFGLNYAMLSANKINEYNGSADKNKKVVILTSVETGSAADNFVYDMKKNDCAYIIGNNTGGEGLGTSFCQYALPNSHLSFTYYPADAIGLDGLSNSVYGTAPDEYSESTDSFVAYLQDHPTPTMAELIENDKTIRIAYDHLIND